MYFFLQSMDKEQPKGTTPRSILQGIVDHFMNLFDVSKVTGCYTRMNDIYSKLGEVHNVMKTLRNLVGLGMYMCVLMPKGCDTLDRILCIYM